ncbi:MAG: hypothetical protein ACW96U_00685 [Candidatus Heimdallarchaeaceae archaeon]|jgi:DNA-directed RNA polymerase subunit RPC12/RpoP
MGRFEIVSKPSINSTFSRDICCPHCGAGYEVMDDLGAGVNSYECSTCHKIFVIESFTETHYYTR